MTLITILGLIATTFSMISFLPQAIQCWKTKRTKDISLQSYLILESAAILWLTYGILQKDFPIILSNVIIGSAAFSILLLKLKYK